jgi:hypothetical protein
MNYMSEYSKLNSLRRRLKDEYIVFEIPICDEKEIGRWLASLDINFVKIIDPVPQGIDSLEPIYGSKGYAWMSFDDGGFRDVWYFHKEDLDAAMLFKLAFT